jgi:hypothetical protein
LLSVCFLLIPQLIIFLFSRRRHPPRHRRHRKYRKYRHDRQYRQAKTADFLASALFLVADRGGLSRGCSCFLLRVASPFRGTSRALFLLFIPQLIAFF